MELDIAKAALGFEWEKVRQLVKRGDDVNLVDASFGQTGLHHAAWCGNRAICELFLESGANINATDKYGDRPLHVAAHCGRATVCELLVAYGADTNAVNKHGQTALHTAADGEKDCPELCEILLKHDAKINAADEYRNQPLHLACNQAHTRTVRLMVSHEVNINAVNKYGQTPLHIAADGWKDCPNLAETLLKHHADINAVDEDGNQPLHLACRKAHIETVRLMVFHGVDTNAVNKHGQTPLHMAAGGEKGCPELCEVLLKHDARINAVDEDGNQPLHFACQKAHTETVKWMVSHGADTNAVNEHGQTPLHTAAAGGNDCPELCEVMLKHNAKINAVDEGGNQPLHLACKQGHFETILLFMSHGASVTTCNVQGYKPQLCYSGNTHPSSELSLIVTSGFNVDATDAIGNCCLHFACEAGRTLAVKALLDCNANVSAVNNDGQTSLHKAASSQRDCPDMCLLLIGKGAKVSAVDSNGDTCLQVALQKGNIKTAEVLLANGADCKVLNHSSETVLHLLCKGGVDSHELCEDLISRGVNPHLADREGNLPLRIAWQKILPKTYHLLSKEWGGSAVDDLQMNIKDLGADLNTHNSIDQPSDQCLHNAASMYPQHNAVGKNTLDLRCQGMEKNIAQAASDRDWEKVRQLVEHGDDVNVVDVFGRTGLHHAAFCGNRVICDLLLKNKANISAMDYNGDQPLHRAAYVSNEAAVCELLVAHGADTTAVNKKAETPLRIAADRQGDYSAVCCPLITNGSVNVADCNDNFSLHCAARNGNAVTVQLLIDCGADSKRVNKHGQTPLHHAAAGGQNDCSNVCEILLKCDARINAVDKNGNQPLHIACKQYHSETVMLMVSHGAGINVVNKQGQTPLHTATGGKKDFPGLCEILVKHDAKINAADKDGSQPLHLACKQDHTEIVKFMVSHGADTNAVNKYGETPLQTAAGRKKETDCLNCVRFC